MAKVSVIIPTRNRRGLLPKAIRSVLDQTHSPVELIVVDDGSEDGTSEMLASSFPQVKALRQANWGCASASNVGIRNSTGDYLTVLGDDDLLEPQALARASDALDQDPGLSLVYTDSRTFLDGTPGTLTLEPSVRAPEAPGALAAALYRNSTLPICSTMIRRKDREGTGWFREILRINEDTDFLIRFLLGSRARWLPESSCRIRIHPGGKSRKPLAAAEALFRSQSDLWDHLPELRALLGEDGKRRLDDLASDLLAAGLKTASLGNVWQALRHLGWNSLAPGILRRTAGSLLRTAP